MLPNDYLKNGYYDEKGNLRREIIVEHAKSIAEHLSNNRMTSASLRRFYGSVVGIKNKYQFTKDFDTLRPMIDQLEPSVEYAHKREVVPKMFVEFINRNVTLARKSASQFLGFSQHFQSIVAYFKDSAEQGPKHFSGGAKPHHSQKRHGGFKK